MTLGRLVKNNRRGQYLLEFLVAFGFFVGIVGALSTLLLDATSLVRRSAFEVIATERLRESMAAVQSIKKQGWSNLPIGSFGLSAQSGVWRLSGASDIANGIVRDVTVAYANRDAYGNIAPTGTRDLLTKSILLNIRKQSSGAILTQQQMYETLAAGTLATETTVTDFQDGTFSGTQTTSTADGGITVASGTATGGFPFAINALATDLDLTSQTTKVSFRMTPTITSPISEIRVYVSRRGSNPPTYRAGLQGSNPDGTPTGTWLGTSQQGFNTFSPAATGWTAIALQESVTIPQGQTVHLVVEWASGTINATRSIELLASNPVNGIIPYDGALHAQSNTLYRSGASWVEKNYEGVYVARSATGAFGNPFSATTSVRIFGTTKQGERFTVGNQPVTLTGVGMYIARRPQVPTDDLLLTVRNVTTNAVLAQQNIVLRNVVTETFTWYTATFPSSITLPANALIRFELSAAGTNTNRSYLVLQNQTQNNGTYIGLSFQGTNAYAETATGTSWSGSTISDLSFRLDIEGGAGGNGTYVSSAFDTTFSEAKLSSIQWDATIPAGATVAVQTRTATTLIHLLSETWVGPDGTSATTYAPLDVIGKRPSTGSRFFQYRVTMTSTGVPPTFESLSFVYEP